MILQDIYDPAIKIGLAAVVGGIIGAEREYRNKTAGLKTIVLICIGSTLFTILSYQIGNEPDRIAANIITGIGFLGAGVIFKDEGKVSGITTASTIWMTAALGMCIGIGNYVLTFIMILAVLMVLVAFARIEDYFDTIHKVYTYSILVKANTIQKEELQTLLKNANLKTSEMKLFKKEDKILFNVSASGHPQHHESFIRNIFSREEVLEFSY